jgi:hypothetical protein
MFDALRLALDVFVEAFALLAEIRQAAAAAGDAALVAVVVLLHHDAIGADHQRALGQLHVAFEGLHLAHVIDADAVGLDVDRLVAVGLFRPANWGGQRKAGDAGKRGVFRDWFMVFPSVCCTGYR